MFFSKFQKKSVKKSVPALVFDFGSSAVKVLLCVYTPGGVEVLDGQKLKYPQDSFNSEERIIEGSINVQLMEVKKNLLARNEGIFPKVAVVGLGGLNVNGFTSVINYRRANADKKITEIEFKNILKRVEDRADQIMRKMINWETGTDENIRLINSEVLKLMVNGYETESPVGTVGEKLTFEVYNSYTHRENLDTVLGAVKTLGLDVVSATATCYTVLRTVRDIVGENGSGVLIDIGAKGSEVGVIDRGRILGHSSFEVAGDAFTNSIAEDLSFDTEQAEMAKLGYSSGKLSNAQMKDVREVVASDCKVLFSGVELVLKEFPGLEEIPAKFFLIGGGSLLPGVSSLWQSASVSDETAPVEFQGELLEPKKLTGYIDKTGKLNSPADIPVLALALDSFDLI
ncbi:MAG: hypothetical protein A2826_01700 [Candidatus Doudnabacteria bacterium RIFCSPHIGHO2_01_FULL_43_23]|uniref:SHS2 domain-containing protein n=1 Tax=Candidatus Doudnabacteria bacterium RIFCSPHIGHO2_01_FULL_43_23 TaxID=1817822 RepID=A0A1F5NRF4_9BACT|nr:MAG: hypothetical protein A2826_01700 [Candidatus Doudnabacteria bacterium RIFCSPHIGHO2_01_FULL_43_23]